MELMTNRGRQSGTGNLGGGRQARRGGGRRLQRCWCRHALGGKGSVGGGRGGGGGSSRLQRWWWWCGLLEAGAASLQGSDACDKLEG